MLYSDSARATLGGCAYSVGMSIASLSIRLARRLPWTGVVDQLREEYETSPSIFDPTPTDAIWEEEHRFLHWKRTAPHKRPPFRPKGIPSGSVRVEFYVDVEMLREGYESDVWADIPLTYSGELELGKVTKLWGLEPHNYAIIDLPRYEPFYPANQERLSRLAVSVHTKDFSTPLRIFETSISQVTCIKRKLRVYWRTSLMLITLFANLIYHGTSSQMDCVVPFPPAFWDIYDLLCDLRHLVYGVVVLIKDCFTDIRRAATRHFESTDFLWLASGGFKVALLFWILLAEAVSCGFIRVW
ncbi:hypothetical protein K443DRAFT_685311 [Laccaria amethystina LaAM-08-1]|uniref:Uncharacterized protein n=1 Tax=Laccaria amethystina LaAM-08-1 TaxID=1095629 RepID=A0A0C9X7I7_9AGAR|nr:hypothetical protein K443DRAFT_685311 [Laccaria amethystina LaAM-08-1]